MQNPVLAWIVAALVFSSFSYLLWPMRWGLLRILASAGRRRLGSLSGLWSSWRGSTCRADRAPLDRRSCFPAIKDAGAYGRLVATKEALAVHSTFVSFGIACRTRLTLAWPLPANKKKLVTA